MKNDRNELQFFEKSNSVQLHIVTATSHTHSTNDQTFTFQFNVAVSLSRRRGMNERRVKCPINLSLVQYDRVRYAIGSQKVRDNGLAWHTEQV